jgi:hypothetical protein
VVDVILEHASARVLLSWRLGRMILREKSLSGGIKLYWIDSTWAGRKLLWVWQKASLISARRLEFRMIDVRNSDGILARLRIAIQDCFEFSNAIDAQLEQYLRHADKNLSRTEEREFLSKKLMSVSIPESSSLARALYLVNVVCHRFPTRLDETTILFINNRPWSEQIAEYASWYSIRLVLLKNPLLDRHQIKNLFVKILKHRMPWLLSISLRVRFGLWRRSSQGRGGKLVVFGPRGIPNLLENGEYSDLPLVKAASFPLEKLVVPCAPYYKGVLRRSGVKFVDIRSIKANYRRRSSSDRIEVLKGLPERKIIKETLNEYDQLRRYWQGFFNFHDIRLFLSSHKYNSEHIAMTAAIRSLGGVGAINQYTFDGYKNLECRTVADVLFAFSNFSVALEKSLQSGISYSVVTGIPSNPIGGRGLEQMSLIRKNIMKAGAKKLLLIIDENSTDDARWHTGHEYQRENYQYALQAVLNSPWLGAVFKPKAPTTLRKRLGEVNELLVAAEKTGRCIVLDGAAGLYSSVSIGLASQAADLCIHGHLCAATAAIECVLAGKPTLLVDREYTPFSKLYELPVGRVIFRDWESALATVLEHFQTEGGVSGLGQWGEFINELDPFQDGNASFRMGTFLKEILIGFENNRDRDVVLADIAERYAIKWGKDTIIENGRADWR